MIHERAYTFEDGMCPYPETSNANRVVNRIAEIRRARGYNIDARVLVVPVLDHVDEDGKKTRAFTDLKNARFKEPLT